MKKHRLGRFVAVVAIVLASLGGSLASPAAANHEFVNPHWRSWEQPQVTTPTCYYFGSRINYCSMVADAVSYWSNGGGFDKGFAGAIPQQISRRCEGRFGYVNVCFVDKTLPQLQGKDGWAYPYTYSFNGDGHAAAVLIYVCGNCGQFGVSDADWATATLRHEMGHALGLGHNTTDPGCIMYDPFPAGSLGPPCQTDIDHMRNQYQHGD